MCYGFEIFLLWKSGLMTEVNLNSELGCVGDTD
jgi:hypothetical protein